MEIKILHLYHDIMNLYGEYGNVCLLEKELKNRGCNVSITKKTVTDSEIDFTDFDFIYCGAGTESSRNFCIEHLRKFSHSIESAFNADKVMLFTGNSYEMLGKTLTTMDGNTRDGIGIFDFEVVEANKRITGDVTFTTEFIQNTMVGFINKCSKVQGIKTPLFTLNLKPEAIDGFAEGMREKNFFGTQVIGPVLVKNPELCKYMADVIIKTKE